MANKKRENLDVNAEIGGKLRALRMERGMSMEQLAKELGLSFQQIQKYETAVNQLSVQRLLEICDVLKVGTDYFIKHSVTSKDIEFQKMVQKFTKLSVDQKKIVMDLIMTF